MGVEKTDMVTTRDGHVRRWQVDEARQNIRHD
jgi:hypothetical protein